MVADKINNKFVAKELLPFVWRVRPNLFGTNLA
jgi:hypothetical protein